MKLFEIQIKPIEGFEKYLNFRETFLKLFHFFNKHPTDNQLGKWWKPTFQKTLSAFLTSNFKALISVSLFLAVCNFQIKTSSSLHDPEKSFWIVNFFASFKKVDSQQSNWQIQIDHFTRFSQNGGYYISIMSV
jgi:hypothetical protein